MSERTISLWAAKQYNQYYAYPGFDLRDNYDIDGYILKGRATYKEDPSAGGYIFLCV